jgi:hypothetical protein
MNFSEKMCKISEKNDQKSEIFDSEMKFFERKRKPKFAKCFVYNPK